MSSIKNKTGILCINLLLILLFIGCIEKKKTYELEKDNFELISNEYISFSFDKKDIAFTADPNQVLEYINIEKNNFFHYFLSKTTKRVYFMESIKNKIIIEKENNNYIYKSSYTIESFDKEFSEQFVSEIIPFLKRKGISWMSIELGIPIDLDKEGDIDIVGPPSTGSFYGNTGNGEIPELIENPYK
jgi:hypothetical protein